MALSLHHLERLSLGLNHVYSGCESRHVESGLAATSHSLGYGCSVGSIHVESLAVGYSLGCDGRAVVADGDSLLLVERGNRCSD